MKSNIVLGAALVAVSLAACSSPAENTAATAAASSSTTASKTQPTMLFSQQTIAETEDCFDQIWMHGAELVVGETPSSEFDDVKATCDAAVALIEEDAGTETGATPANRIKVMIAEENYALTSFRTEILFGGFSADALDHYKVDGGSQAVKDEAMGIAYTATAE